MPFLIVLAAGSTAAFLKRSRIGAWAVAVLVLLDVASSLHAFPNYLPYSNEAFGGPSRTYRVLDDSNVAWGGGLKALHAFLDQRKITQCWFAYDALPDPANFQIPCKRLPTFFTAISDMGQQQPVPVHIDGPVFMSSEQRTGSFFGPGPMNPYQQFVNLRPSNVIAGGILEYDGSFDIPRVAAISEWVYAIVISAAATKGWILRFLMPRKLWPSIQTHSTRTKCSPTPTPPTTRTTRPRREYHASLQLYHASAVPAYLPLANPPTDPLAQH